MTHFVCALVVFLLFFEVQDQIGKFARRDIRVRRAFAHTDQGVTFHRSQLWEPSDGTETTIR